MDIMPNNLIKSKYLVIIQKSEDEYVVYHRLYGNLRLLNHECKKILDLSENTPMIPSDHKELLYYITYLYNIYYLIEPNENERSYIKFKERILGEKDVYEIGGIQLIINNNCNFICKYCFANTANNRRSIIIA